MLLSIIIEYKQFLDLFDPKIRQRVDLRVITMKIGLVLWHVNHSRLFKDKYGLFIYNIHIWFANISQQR